MHQVSLSRKLFTAFNYMFLIIICAISLLPLINILSMSLSSAYVVDTGKVGLWPVAFTLDAYKYVINTPQYLRSMFISLERVFLGVGFNMFFTILMSYPLSKSTAKFKRRNLYAWILIVAMIFNGGLIPTFLIVKETGLIDKIWALILPCAVGTWYIILLHNFFKNIPVEMEEASLIDGAGPWRTLWQIYVPLSKPALATILLFSAVNHWNSWFDGLIYMNRSEHYPLQSYLQTVVINPDVNLLSREEDLELYMKVSAKNNRAAQIFLAMLPILIVYPFLQKYFTKGIILGSVKG